MQIVIEIDEKQYEFIKQSMTMYKIKDYPALLYDICERIKNGTPLPKGHGRLIDADKTKDVMMDVMCGTGYQGDAMWVVESEYCSPTVVEADKEMAE